MLKLDKHLQYQMNHFHGGYFDFIYKINEVLEYNNIKESFYNDAVKVIKDKKENIAYDLTRNENYELYKIAFNMVTLINEKNKKLGEHLNKVLSVIICETSTIVKNYNPSASC